MSKYAIWGVKMNTFRNFYFFFLFFFGSYLAPGTIWGGEESSLAGATLKYPGKKVVVVPV
jgi:hypothetical protein